MIRPPWRRRPPQPPGLAAHDGRTASHAAATHYATLGVTRDARAKDIVRAYRRLAKHHHPDVSADLAGAEAFTRASAAYDVLSDPARRSAYDASLDAAAAAAPRRRATLSASRGETTMLVGLAVLACVGLLYIAAFALGYRADRAGAPPTDRPVVTAPAGAPSPSGSPDAAGVPSAPASTSPSPLTGRTAPVGAPVTLAPAASPSPQPSAPSLTASPTATPIPQPSSTAPPAPQAPTATAATCVAPNVIGMRRNSVQAMWIAAGFGTPVNFLPGTGNYAVATQSPVGGTTASCATATLLVGP